MQEDKRKIIEKELEKLVEAIGEAGRYVQVRKEAEAALESVRSAGWAAADRLEIEDLIFRIVNTAKPALLDPRWEESWGTLFSLLIDYIIGSQEGAGRIIRLLYGPGQFPEAASGERVLCINPGSTSTKLALYSGIRLEAGDEVHIPPEFEDGVEARTEAITKWVEGCGLKRGELTGITCRGGFIKPIPTGTYEVCRSMIDDLEEAKINHASNMAIPIGMLLKEKFAGDGGLFLTTTDPVGSDEMETAARLTGIRKLLRDGSGAHYLSHNAVHGLVSSILGVGGKDLTTISAHLGGGISIARHCGGQITDLVNAFAGVPSANRSGNVPLDVLMFAVDNMEISLPELKKYLYGEGGLIDLTGTNDFRALLHFRDSGAREEQRSKIELVIDFMTSNIAGAIMKLAALERKIDLVVLTGGLARSTEFTRLITRKLLPYFPSVVIPGSIEHEAMIAGHIRAKYKPEMLKDYTEERDRLRKHRSFEKDLINTEIFTNPQFRKKEGDRITSLDEVMYLARTMVAKYRTPRIAIVGAENEDAIAAAKQANEEGRYPVAKFLLVGDYYEVNKLAWEYDITVDGDNYTIVDSVDPVERAVQLLASGEADLLMKGGVKTAEIMGGTLKYLKESGRIRKGRIYSHVGFFQIPTYPKLLLVTDAALIPNPNRNIKKKILENAVTVAGYLNIRNPKIAVISAVETRNPSVESSMEAAEFAEEYKDRTDCIVEGPLSLDVAMDPHSAREKHYGGRIQGNADVLLMPDIEAGNVVYKSLTVSSGAYLAGAIMGAGVPIVLTSRGDSARSKLASICLASIIAMKQGDIAAGG